MLHSDDLESAVAELQASCASGDRVRLGFPAGDHLQRKTPTHKFERGGWVELELDMRARDLVAGLGERASNLLGRRVRASTPLGRALRWIKWHLPRTPPERALYRVIYEYARLEPRASFVQIGAHDGTQLDPLRAEILSRRWRGVMVEPVDYVFRRLQRHYGRNPRITLENVAIADVEGTLDFHHLPEAAPGEAPWKWYDALGSFDREVLLSHRHLIPDIDERIVTTPVRCYTFDGLCRRHGLQKVDVVQVDAEGYDDTIVKLIDLERYEPKLLMYEVLHLSEDRRRALELHLRSSGYVGLIDPMDALWVRSETLDRYPALAALVAHRDGDAPT